MPFLTRSSPPHSSLFQVRVLIVDINDNTPLFPPNGYSVKISEGAKANSDVIAAVAIDPDSGSNSELVYELISGNTGSESNGRINYNFCHLTILVLCRNK